MKKLLISVFTASLLLSGAVSAASSPSPKVDLNAAQLGKIDFSEPVLQNRRKRGGRVKI